MSLYYMYVKVTRYSLLKLNFLRTLLYTENLLKICFSLKCNAIKFTVLSISCRQYFMFTLSLLYVYLTLRLPYIYRMFILCLPYVYCTFTLRLPYVYHTLLYIYLTFSLQLVYVYHKFSLRLLYVYRTFTVCLLNVFCSTVMVVHCYHN